MAEGLVTMDLIVVKQLPVISESLRTISADIDEKLAIADALVCSEENVTEIKKVRAGFSKDFEEIEELRKRIKTTVLAPYEEFEAVYKECVSNKYKAADKTLKDKIDEVTNTLKARKAEAIKAYYNEYAKAKNVSEYADFERQMGKLTRMSDTDTALKRIAREMIDPLVSGLAAIDAQPEDRRAEILAEFKKTLKATEAIAIVNERHKAIEAQRIQQAEREKANAAESETAAKVEAAALQPLAPPVSIKPEDDDPVRRVKFSVMAPLSKLRELKRFLIDGGYQYE